MASGKSSGRISSPEPSTTARSIAFSNSRTLPGQSYRVKQALASGEIPITCRLHFRLYFAAK